jgi:hypothetical protein
VKVITKLIVLKDMTKAWTKFYELFHTLVGCIFVAKIPLTYLISDVAVVTVTQDNGGADYDMEVDRLEATMVHQGSHYTINNTTLYKKEL